MATDRLTIEVDANTSGVDKLNESLKKLNNQLNRVAKRDEEAGSGFKKITQSVNGFARAIERIDISPIERLAAALEKISATKLPGTAKQIQKVAQAGQGLAEKSGAESLPSASGSVSGATAVASVGTATTKVSTGANKGAKAMQKLGSAFKYVKSGAKDLMKPLTGLISVFGRMILFNLVFRFLMVLSDAINVGITNLYNYSKAWDNIDWTRAQQSMDDLSATAQQVKNTFGVTLMSVIVALKPLIDSLANAFMNAANCLNAFLAALNGSAYFTKATKQAKEFGEATTSAAKAAQNATAGIDELNIISDSSGGGGGAATPDYSTMFEEVKVPKKITDFLTWVQDHLKEILWLVGLIAAGLLAWKLASIIPGLTSLGKKLGFLIGVIGAVMFAFGFLDALMNGLTWENLIMMVGGVALAFIGLSVAFGLPVGAIALLVGGIGLVIAALVDFIKTGEITAENLMAIQLGIIAIGVAIGILTGSWIPVIIAAIVTAVVTIAAYIYQHWDEIKAKLQELWATITEFFATLWETISNWFMNVANKVVEFFTNVGEKIVAFKDKVVQTVTLIKDKIKQIITTIKTNVTTIVTNIITTVTNKVTAFKTSVLNIFQGIWTGIKNVINSILGGIEGMVNGVINGLNKMINALNSLSFTVPDWVPEIGGGVFGFNLATINTITIPRLATGGMVDAGQLFIANEAGAEMIGSMGGNTTVANNEQIVAGIQQGVEIAVSQILAPYLSDIADNTRETANKDFSVALGDREIAKASIRGQRKLGRSIISTV